MALDFIKVLKDIFIGIVERITKGLPISSPYFLWSCFRFIRRYLRQQGFFAMTFLYM